MLESIHSENLKDLDNTQLKMLCEEIRSKIISTVEKKGGHLSSNLGAIEITVALHTVFNFPKDKVVFDVGHQCYAHKLLSGRYNEFDTLRTYKGLSGFPKRAESEFDCYDTGHAGTSVSAALGLAKARDIKKEDFYVVCIIGDGSFNNGLIFEALNSLKILNTKILIILNDNGMSIAPTVGGTHEILKEIPKSPKDIALFEQYGLKYKGIYDGNNVEEMIEALKDAKKLLKKQSVLLHVHTKKGKGYEFCEEFPMLTHGISPKGSVKQQEYGERVGETLKKLAKQNKNIAVVTAAMTESLGLKEFFLKYPERSFDVGICEENASILCASLAAGGMKPYYAIYSTFLQRSFDEIIHDICAQDLPVTFCIDRGGVSGADGETHQGVFDLSYLSFIPNITIAVPKDLNELESMIEFSACFNHPLAIRYPRGGIHQFGDKKAIESLKWEVLSCNMSDIVLLACGERALSIAYSVEKRLQENKISKKITIVNSRFVKPLDKDFLNSLSSNNIITIEDNVLYGGFGQAVDAFYSLNNKKIKNFGYCDSFLPQGSINELMRDYGLNEEDIYQYILNL